MLACHVGPHLEYDANCQTSRVEPTILTSPESNVAFLQLFLDELRNGYHKVERLSDDDFLLDEIPTTSDDEERCARLADASKIERVDGNLFRNLFAAYDLSSVLRRAARQIRTIPLMIAEIQESPAVPASTKPHLTSNDLRILCYLAKQPLPRTQTEIESGTLVSRKTISKQLDFMRGQGLVERPKGARGGEVITEVGRERIEGIDPPAH
jgi:DNA-binding MarR family transcriptional regulator